MISRTVHEAVTGRVKATFDDLGSLALKNIERPVQAFSVKWEPSDWQLPVTSEVTVAPATAPQVPLPLPDKPSIAVLPFQNMSGDPEQEYFADGMVEDIITALSRFKSLFVIARNSSFTYKGKAVDIKQVGRELGVRYVLEGSVRKAANRVRITGQLIDAATGAHLWADRFDGALEDVFELQDQVTTSVVGAIAPRVEQAEIERAQAQADRKPRRLRLLPARHGQLSTIYRGTAIDEAIALFRHARSSSIPTMPPPTAMAAHAAAYAGAFITAGWQTATREMAEARRWLDARVASGRRDDALALCWAALRLPMLADDLDAGRGADRPGACA